MTHGSVRRATNVDSLWNTYFFTDLDRDAFTMLSKCSACAHQESRRWEGIHDDAAVGVGRDHEEARHG